MLFTEFLAGNKIVEQDKDASTKLTDMQMDELRKLIKKGTAKNKETGGLEPWKNALHLVHAVYKATGIQRPTPEMKDAWSQYTEIIGIAVKELSRTRGINAEWRVSQHHLRGE